MNHARSAVLAGAACLLTASLAGVSGVAAAPSSATAKPIVIEVGDPSGNTIEYGYDAQEEGKGPALAGHDFSGYPGDSAKKIFGGGRFNVLRVPLFASIVKANSVEPRTTNAGTATKYPYPSFAPDASKYNNVSKDGSGSVDTLAAIGASESAASTAGFTPTLFANLRKEFEPAGSSASKEKLPDGCYEGTFAALPRVKSGDSRSQGEHDFAAHYAELAVDYLIFINRGLAARDVTTSSMTTPVINVLGLFQESSPALVSYLTGHKKGQSQPDCKPSSSTQKQAEAIFAATYVDTVTDVRSDLQTHHLPAEFGGHYAQSLQFSAPDSESPADTAGLLAEQSQGSSVAELAFHTYSGQLSKDVGDLDSVYKCRSRSTTTTPLWDTEFHWNDSAKKKFLEATSGLDIGFDNLDCGVTQLTWWDYDPKPRIAGANGRKSNLNDGANDQIQQRLLAGTARGQEVPYATSLTATGTINYRTHPARPDSSVPDIRAFIQSGGRAQLWIVNPGEDNPDYQVELAGATVSSASGYTWSRTSNKVGLGKGVVDKYTATTDSTTTDSEISVHVPDHSIVEVQLQYST